MSAFFSSPLYGIDAICKDLCWIAVRTQSFMELGLKEPTVYQGILTSIYTTGRKW